MAKSPAQIVKDKFGEKKALVEAVQKFVTDELWVPRLNESKGLAHVSNAKLLRLLETFTAVQAKWGTRAKLIDAVVEAAGRAKDAGFRTRVAGWPVPRLLDAHRSYEHRTALKAAAEKAKTAPKTEKKAAPKVEKKVEKKAEKPAAKKAAKKK